MYSTGPLEGIKYFSCHVAFSMLVSIRIWELFFKQETGTYMFSFSDFFFFFFPLFGANLSQKDAKIFQESCRFTGLTEIGLFFFGVLFFPE